MIGKMILPLALGGGLLFLLASNASAAPVGQNPLNVLPEDLRQLAAQALATNDPSTLEQVAAQIESRGFPEQGRILRMQSAAIRQQRESVPSGAPATPSAPATTPTAAQNPLNLLPDELRSRAGQALGTNSPGMIEQVASDLDQQGFHEQAGLLRVQATKMRAQQGGSTVAAAPLVSPSSALALPAPPSLTPELQQMIAEAIKNGTAPALTSTAFVVERAGFPQVADDLRKRAKEMAATVAPPPAQDRPNVALDPSMPADLALEVARQLQLQGDPSLLEGLAGEMRKRGFNNTATQLEAKAKQIRAALDAARTMNDIDREFKSPGVVPPTAQFTPAASMPPPSPVSTPAPLPAPTPPASFPMTVTATPPAPLPVPATPQAQPAPPEKSKAQILAEVLAAGLNDLLERFGSVPKARFKEDKTSVQRFQSQEGLKPDGSYGPDTASHVARYVSDVPPPFYWKKGAGQRDLSTYRSNLESIALDADQTGNHDRAQRLRASALKASLA
jgi:hypothetical protein